MRKLSLASAIAAACLFTAFTASAGENTVDVQLEYSVAASCLLTSNQSVISASPDGFFEIEGNFASQSSVQMRGELMAGCNLGLPFTIETNAGPNGVIQMVGNQTGSIVPVRIVQGYDGEGDQPFGSLANSEHYSDVGTGTGELVDYRVFFNNDGSMVATVPEVDVYAAVLTFTQTF